MTRRQYSGPLLDVSFDASVCLHAGECVRCMPIVFDVERRPWIDPSIVDSRVLADRLRQVVGQCPSGALAVVEHEATP